MQSSLIGKVEKAKRYAQERDRVKLSELTASFRGEHDNYEVSYKNGKWHCTCNFFSSWKLCSHTMALQMIMDKMLPEEALTTPFETTR